MFERYTEKARRVIFFARYEASHYGSPVIDSEHLLLGLLREDKSLHRWLPETDGEAIRRRVDAHTPKRPPTSTALDLPLSETGKHVLKLAPDEADRLAHMHIGTEHLFLALMDVEDCFAAELMRDGGADARTMRLKLSEQPRQLWSPLQRERHYGKGFRRPSGETVEIHGTPWNADYVRDLVSRARTYNWHWHKAQWKPRDVVINRHSGAFSFDLGLAKDPENFTLVEQGWKKDHCFICRWELFECEDEHGTGYTNGNDWLCMECCERFLQRPDFFSSSQSEIT
jgi:hypothetical protein